MKSKVSAKSVKEVYNHGKVESKWQKRWAQDSLYEPDMKEAGNKFYNLWMFPYPSAEGLHAGHAFASTGSDVIGRYMRMKGKTVFQPIGYDSFGIHSENFAIKIGETPQKMLARTTKHYEDQLRSLGHGYDWTRTVTTSDVDYYKWTQWLFIEMFKAGLAYKKAATVNWCPSCKTVLADEQVMTPAAAGKLPSGYEKLEDVPEGVRVCERCGTIVEKKELNQWFFRITDYASRLLDNLEKIDWSPRVVIAQREWIGRSTGALVEFKLKDSQRSLEVYTTRPDTIKGVTFMAVSPEKAEELLNVVPPSHKEKLQKYIKSSLNKTEQSRKEGERDKTGVDTGIFAINPVNGEEIPVWAADYVLSEVGTGAVMGVPAGDKRDEAFAKRHGLEIKDFEFYSEAIGKKEVRYHLRDWLISRQRYWGPPIPMIYCETCAKNGVGWLSLNESVASKAGQTQFIHKDYTDWDHSGWYPASDLPVELPEIKDYQPEGTGSGPLANHPEFYSVSCPHCGGEAKRETDVSDTFVDSSWYFLRYPTVGASDVEKRAFDTDITRKWLPVDLYFGGAEHAVLHLMYARFVTMVLHDLGKLDFEEPFPRFFAHGLMIKDGAKMSKSRGNVVNPDEYVQKYGADTLRLYLMFMGPMDGYPDFRDTGIEGMQKFVRKLFDTIAKGKDEVKANKELDVKMHQTIKKVTQDISTFNYNTAISSIMKYVNALREAKVYSKDYAKVLTQLIAPFAPHLAEESWELLGEEFSVHTSQWPDFNEAKMQELHQTIVIQINGKLKGQVVVDKEKSGDKDYIESLARGDTKVSEILKKTKVNNTVFVPGRLVNFVTS